MATSLYVQTCFERKFLRKSIRNKIEILKMLFSFVVHARTPQTAPLKVSRTGLEVYEKIFTAYIVCSCWKVCPPD